jgi:hypothetical protein
MITYKVDGDKHIFCKNGVYWGLTKEDLHAMHELLENIIASEKKEEEEKRLTATDYVLKYTEARS